MLYLAYGSNLNKEQMRLRCPNAQPLHGIVINNYRLVFKYIADIEPYKDSILYAGLWRITEKCEKHLDAYEGVDSGLYHKKYFVYKEEKVLYYKMNEEDTYLSPPSPSYRKTIKKGYKNFRLPIAALYEAVEHAKCSMDDDWETELQKEKNEYETWWSRHV
jgi:hypothetical protein